MDRKKEQVNKLFELITRIKKINLNRNELGNVKPSEEMLLFKINILYGLKPVKVSDIVASLKFAPSTVSTILHSLEYNGYIERKISKEDRREVYVSITKKGEQSLKIIKEKHWQVMSDLISYLGPEDTNKLTEILDKMLIFFEEKANNNLKGKNEDVETE